MRRPDLMSKDWNNMNERERSIVCRQMFKIESHRHYNRKEQELGASFPGCRRAVRIQQEASHQQSRSRKII